MYRLQRYRSYARVIALALLLAAPATLQHGGKDDFACAPLGQASSDGDVLHGSPSDAPEHCLVCHWTRSLRSPSAAPAAFDSELIPAARVDAASPQAARAPSLSRLPARAPPVSL